jgi:phytoene dehydrogenase-like protein
MSRSVGAVVIGSGHNGLVAAAYLARAGWGVEVLERNAEPGGAVATEELTEPGFRHDTFSSWHPLFHTSGAWAELGDELRARGLEYVNAEDVVTASVTAEGAVVAHRDAERTLEGAPAADRDAYLEDVGSLGEQMDVIGELLGTRLASPHAARLATTLARRLGVRDGLAFGARLASSARGWLESRFAGREAGDLLAPWVLHTGLTPDDAGGGFQLVALTGALHEIGMPVVRGGSDNFVKAFVRLIEDHGGTVRTAAEVDRIVVRGGRAAGVVVGDEEILAERAVISNTTPTQLYLRLLPTGAVPARVVAEAARFRFADRAGTQIHLALSEPPRWRGEARLAEAPVVHVTGGLNAVSLACAQARVGLLPAEPTIVCGQPTALDPSRAPEGAAIIWIQLQEVPYRPVGDAAGEIEVTDAGWTEELERAYADRIVAHLARHIENLPDAVVGRAILSPTTLERRNPNFVRGDIYAGAAQLDQSYLWRPLPSYGSHAAPVDGLYECGASTYPGPGLNAASGRIVAMELLKPPVRKRLRARLARS